LAFLADSDALVIDFRIVRRKQIARAIVDRAGGVGFLLGTGGDDQGHDKHEPGKQKPIASNASLIEQAHNDRLSRASYSSRKNRVVDKPPPQGTNKSLRSFCAAAGLNETTLNQYVEIIWANCCT
jgi:hypothetical protein